MVLREKKMKRVVKAPNFVWAESRARYELNCQHRNSQNMQPWVKENNAFENYCQGMQKQGPNKNHSFIFIFSDFKNMHSFCKNNGTFPLNKLKKKNHLYVQLPIPSLHKCHGLRLLTPDLSFVTALSQSRFLFHSHTRSLPSQQTVGDSRRFSP